MFGTTTIHKRDQPALHLPATGDVVNRSMKRFSSPQPAVCRPLSPGLGIRNRWCTILDREKAYAIGKSRPARREPIGPGDGVNANRRGANAAREVDSQATCSGSQA